MDFKGMISFLETKMLRRKVKNIDDKVKNLGTDIFTVQRLNPEVQLKTPAGDTARLLLFNNDTVDYGLQFRYDNLILQLDPTSRELWKWDGSTKYPILHRGNIGTENLRLETASVAALDLAISSDPTKNMRVSLNKSASVDYGPTILYDGMRWQLDPSTREQYHWYTSTEKYKILHEGNVSHPHHSNQHEVAGCWVYTSDNFPTLYDDNLWHKLNFNVVLRNNDGWNFSEFNYVAPRAGLYHFDTRITWVNATQGSRMALRLMTDLGNLTTLQDTRVYYNDKYTIGGATILWLEAGQKVWCEYLCNGTTGVLENTSASSNLKVVQLN